MSGAQLEPAGPVDSSASWGRFVGATTADARARAWLELVCAEIDGARAAAVLVESPTDHHFLPLAVWPKATPDLGKLGAVVEAALRERRGMAKAQETPGVWHLAYPVFQGEAIGAVVALDVLNPALEPGEAFRRLHWGAGWLNTLLASRDLVEASEARDRLRQVLDCVAVALRHGELRQALFELCNTLRHQLECARVAIGLPHGRGMKLWALSEAASFDRHAAYTKACTAAMNETFDACQPLMAPGDEGEGAIPAPKLAALGEISGASAALAYPLMLGGECRAVLVLERERGGFGGSDLTWVDALAALLAPIVEQRRKAEQGSLRHFRDDAGRFLKKLFGPRHLTWKAASISIVVALALLAFLPIEHRVSARTVIEGEVQRVVAAPFQGFLGAAYVRAGDQVEQGALVAQLDDRELLIEQARWSSERDQHAGKLREAFASHDLASIQVLGAQLRQAESQLALIEERIVRARLLAPFDGLVISGDLSQQVGAPLEMGQKLFEIAPLRSYRIIMEVDERDIRFVAEGQTGRLVMTGIAGEPMPFEVGRLTPVASTQDGRNFFRIEALLDDASPRLRPGMEGIGKIDTGRASLGWVLTRRFNDWLTLTLWSWLP